MISFIRKQLDLPREQMAWYLILSISMVKKVELGQRPLSTACNLALTRIFHAIKNVQAKGHIDVPSSSASAHLRRMKRAHRECRRTLELRTEGLKQMQESYNCACFQIEVYKQLAESMNSPGTKDDKHRIKWANGMTMIVQQRIKDIGPEAQGFVVAEIAGLKSQLSALEASNLFRSMPQTTK